MRQLLLRLRYRGTRYHGFQVQKQTLTVAQVIQDAVEKVFGARLDIKGCSRTDAGVHANDFALTLRTDSNIPCEAVVRAMNVNLPQDVAVTDCQEVADGFHPRYDCVGKRYLYKIHNAQVRDPFLSDLALYHRYPLDPLKMNQAAQALVGTYDFSAFCSAGSAVEDRVRTIHHAVVTQEGEMVLFSVTGNGFLYNMVRIMVGTLLEVSQGKIAPEEIIPIILSKDRSRAGITAPAHGLYLDHVFYQAF